MPSESNNDINDHNYDLELFKKNEYDDADLALFYATVTNIKLQLQKDKKEFPNYLNAKSFMCVCNKFFDACVLKTKNARLYCFYKTLKGLFRLSLNFFQNDPGERHKWEKLFAQKTETGNHHANKNRQVSKSDSFLVLALEKSKGCSLLSQLTETDALTISDENFSEFYRLPWFWHSGTGNLEDIKARLTAALSVPAEESDSIIIGAILKNVPGINITPKIKGSEMRAVFEKLKGTKFERICEFKMTDLGKSDVNFYRMP